MSGVDRFNQRADLALAKQGLLTDKELLGIDDLRDAWNAQSDAFNSWDELGIDEIIWFAQQQAIARYAHLAQPEPADLSGVSWPDSGPITARAVFADGTCYLLDTQPEPEPEGVTARELQWPPSVAQGCHEAAAEAEPGSPMQQLLVAAGDLLENYARPAIQPVTVAERPWEREGWCDADGECWWCPRDGPPYWQMANPAMVYGGWLLPHHALPIPQPAPGS
jgi:hypothetical protein